MPSQEEVEKKRRKSAWIWIVLGVILLIILYNSAKDTNRASPYTSSYAPPVQPAAVWIKSLEWDSVYEHGRWQSVLRGSIRANRSCSYIAVEGSLLDDSGNHVRGLLINTTNLQAGKIWKIEHKVFDDKVARFSGITLKGNCK